MGCVGGGEGRRGGREGKGSVTRETGPEEQDQREPFLEGFGSCDRAGKEILNSFCSGTLGVPPDAQPASVHWLWTRHPSLSFPKCKIRQLLFGVPLKESIGAPLILSRGMDPDSSIRAHVLLGLGLAKHHCSIAWVAVPSLPPARASFPCADVEPGPYLAAPGGSPGPRLTSSSRATGPCTRGSLFILEPAPLATLALKTLQGLLGS